MAGIKSVCVSECVQSVKVWQAGVVCLVVWGGK